VEILFKVFKQTSWQVLGKAISSIATVIALGFITRSYGPSGTGVITLALTYLAFFSLAVDFGVNAFTLPSLLKENYQIEWQKLFGFRLVLAFFLTLIALSLPFFISADPLFHKLVWIGAFFAIFEAAIYISSNAIFQSKLRFDLATLAYSTGAVVELLIIIFLSINKAPLSDIILAYAGGWVVISATALILVKKFVTPLPTLNFDYSKNLLKGVWPIALTLVVNTVYFRLDAFVLSHFYSFSEVGIYNVAYSVFQSALVVPTFIMNAFYPLLIKKLHESEKEFKKIFLQSSEVMLGLGGFGTGLTLVLSGLVIQIVTGGRGFEQSVTALDILSLSFPAFFLSALGMWTLLTLKKYRLVLVIYLIGLISNLVLNLIFIPQFSFYGASYVTVICEYLILILQLFFLWRHFYGSSH
jgi:O-antigen/teichoic acid export membrane protein